MATRANIVIDQGTDFTAQINVANSSGSGIDLSGYSVSSKIRKTYSSSNSVSFNATANSSGAVVLTINAASTLAISPGRYVYDVLLTDNVGKASRLIEGQVTVNPAVTK